MSNKLYNSEYVHSINVYIKQRTIDKKIMFYIKHFVFVDFLLSLHPYLFGCMLSKQYALS